jgi:endonuclease/exonuclease/phosphatase family metal-dependent hydrolase
MKPIPLLLSPFFRLRAVWLFAALLCACGDDQINLRPEIEWTPGGFGPITVMTYNVLCPVCTVEFPWTERLPAFRSLIARHNPDLIAAQELIIPIDADHFLGTLPPAADGGPAYERLCRANCDNVAYYRRERFELLDNGSVWLSSWPYRYAAWAALRDRLSGATFLFVYAHFDNRQPNQEKSAAVLRNALAPWLERGAPVIVAGDFNSSASGSSQVHDGHAASQPGYQALAAFLKNTYDMATDRRVYTNHPEPDTNTFLFENMIDHIFVSPATTPGRTHWRVLNWGVDYWWATSEFTPRPRYPSDHWPVVTRLEYLGADAPSVESSSPAAARITRLD